MKKIFYIVLCTLTLVSCRKLIFDAPLPADYVTTFDYLWQRIHQDYCCFDIANIDWDDVYTDFAPQISNDMSEASFTELIEDMLSLLEDHNLSVTTPSGDIRYSDFQQHPTNLDTNTVKFYNPTKQPYMIYDSIAYINCFDEYYTLLTDSGVEYDVYFFEGAMNRVNNNNLKGAILDFRNLLLPLGNSYNAIDINIEPHDFIRVGEQRPIGISRRKSGPAPDDFIEMDLDETANGSGYEGPIIILINHQTFAGNTYNAFRTSELSNTMLMGTDIGSGNFGVSTSVLPNGWLLHIPKTAMFDIQGNSIGRGMQPDIYVEDNTATTDIDEVIEAALNELR